MGEVVGVEDNRLAPAEVNQEKHQCPQWVEVSQGIKSKSALRPGGRVTQSIGGESVGEFVNGDGDDESKNQIKCFNHG